MHVINVICTQAQDCPTQFVGRIQKGNHNMARKIRWNTHVPFAGLSMMGAVCSQEFVHLLYAEKSQLFSLLNLALNFATPGSTLPLSRRYMPNGEISSMFGSIENSQETRITAKIVHSKNCALAQHMFKMPVPSRHLYNANVCLSH